MIFPSTIIVTESVNEANEKINTLLSQIDQKNTPNNPDIFHLNQETGWGIDAVRQIRHFFSTKPFNHQTKLVVISEAQNLQTEAQNALLKSLEEPGDGHFFILITTNPQLLLPTIISRCQILLPSSSHLPAIDHFHLSTNSSDNLFTSESLTSDKTLLPQILQEQLRYYHQQFLSKPNSTNKHLIEYLIKTSQMIKANVEPKSALDYFFLTANI